jgi:hypothetical protein
MNIYILFSCVIQENKSSPLFHESIDAKNNKRKIINIKT